jgi:hypothetical protein
MQTRRTSCYDPTVIGFTEMEKAALQAIFRETPAVSSELQRQLDHATVTKRENTGGGFFTDIAVPEHVPPVDCPKVLCYATHARVEGLEHGLGFVLFMEGGKLHLFEGFAWGPESTGALNLSRLSFEIYHKPIQWLD